MPSIEEAFANSALLIPKLNQSLSNVFNLRCLPRTKQALIGKLVKCKVEFKNGRLVVDDSVGIKHSQVVNILGHEVNANWVVEVSYFNSKNKYSIANFYNSKTNFTIPRIGSYPFTVRLNE